MPGTGGQYHRNIQLQETSVTTIEVESAVGPVTVIEVVA